MSLVLENVSVGYRQARIIQNVSLTLGRGEFVSLIGPNGAGKTTLLNAISGQLPLASGRILYQDMDITHWKADRRAKAGIGRSFQTTHLFPNLTVLENVLLAIQAKNKMSWISMVTHVSKTNVERAHYCLERVQLQQEVHKPARLLSHGDKRKLELGMLLAQEPQVILLDEPTAGMAVSAVPDMLQLIRGIKTSQHFTVILVEHKLDVVMNLSDRIIVLQQGMLLADGPPAEVIQNEAVQAAYLGGKHGSLA